MLGILRPTLAQQKKVVVDYSPWYSFISNGRLNHKSGITMDAQHIPGSLSLVRAGYVYFLPQRTDVTVGYARLWLRAPGALTDALERNEHRPWLQLQHRSGISRQLTLRQRLRYELRFLQAVQLGHPQQAFNHNHRLRLQEHLQLYLPGLSIGKAEPSLILSEEILLNFGRNISHNTFDQNRLAFLLGLKQGPLQLQTGYTHRFVQSGSVSNRYISQHNLVVWLIYNIDFRKTPEQVSLFSDSARE